MNCTAGFLQRARCSFIARFGPMPDGGDDGDEKNPNKVDPEALERALEKLCVTKCTKMDMTNHKTAYNALRRIAKRFIIKKIRAAKFVFFTFFKYFFELLVVGFLNVSTGTTGDG